VKAPSLEDFELMAEAAYRRLPQGFRALCEGLVIRGTDAKHDLVYRRPILDYWAEHEETLGKIVAHVLVHEIGHHFGLSDDDMAGIEDSVK
jgi:predicted Zn-dependent protease with MMP-like domain